MNVLKFESYHHGIAVSSVINVIANVCSFISNLIVAYYFGARVQTDVYFFCLTSLLFLSGIIVSSLNTTVVIPESIGLALNDGEEAAMRFLNYFLYAYAAVGLVGGAVIFSVPIELLSSVSGFADDVAQANLPLLRLTGITFFLMIPCLHLTDVLVSRRYFSLTALLNVGNSLVVTLFILAFQRRMGIASAMLGLGTAYLLQCVVLVMIARRGLSWRFANLRLRPRRRLWTNILFTQAGYVTSNTANYAPMPLLSGLGPGRITAYGLAQRVMNIPGTFVMTQLTNVVGIKFNELAARNDWNKINDVLINAARVTMFLVIPVSALMLILSDDIIAVLFRHGAFDAVAARHAGAFLAVFSPLPPLMVINSLASRVCIAALKVKIVSVFQVIANLGLAFAMVVGVGYFGALWCALVILLTYLVMVLVWHPLLRHSLPQIRYGPVLRCAGNLFLVNALVGVPVYLLLTILPAQASMLKLAAGGLSYAAFFLVLTRVLNVTKEVNTAVDQAIQGLFSGMKR